MLKVHVAWGLSHCWARIFLCSTHLRENEDLRLPALTGLALLAGP